MTARRIGFWIGLAGFLVAVLTSPAAGMPPKAWLAAGLVWWMAVWWMTEALPLYVTAMLPFVVLPLLGIADVNKTASAYYSPVMFLILGGAFLALAIERTGLHRRLALAILARSGDRPWHVLLAVMTATALMSMIVQNTTTALIMMPLALGMLAAGGIEEGDTHGMAGALPIGIAFAANIGGLGTIVGTPTNAISAGIISESMGRTIGFAEWSLYGLPLVAIGIPIACAIVARVQRLDRDRFDPAATRIAIGQAGAWSQAEKRLAMLLVLAVAAWIALSFVQPLLPKGTIDDGTVAVVAGIALFLLPDGAGRPMLTWPEANRAPWDVVLMFGGGLALAMGMGDSGLAAWIGEMLMPLSAVPLIVVALVVVTVTILITEFASNIAVAAAIMPVIAALAVALGADPILLALPAAIAATWGFMLPSGTGPNAIAWASGHVALPRVLKAGFILDVAGIFLIVGVVWAIAAAAG
ncbi:MAG: SLC13 family permease [Novosphingobium sp.]